MVLRVSVERTNTSTTSSNNITTSSSFQLRGETALWGFQRIIARSLSSLPLSPCPCLSLSVCLADWLNGCLFLQFLFVFWLWFHFRSLWVLSIYLSIAISLSIYLSISISLLPISLSLSPTSDLLSSSPWPRKSHKPYSYFTALQRALCPDRDDNDKETLGHANPTLTARICFPCCYSDFSVYDYVVCILKMFFVKCLFWITTYGIAFIIDIQMFHECSAILPPDQKVLGCKNISSL